MSETMFAKVFLGSLDRKPVKLGSDYISDPKQYPAQSPVARQQFTYHSSRLLTHVFSTSSLSPPILSPDESDQMSLPSLDPSISI